MTSSAAAPGYTMIRRIRSRPAEIENVCQELRDLLLKQGRRKEGFALELTARECLNNALLHGNEGDERKHIELKVRGGRKWAWLQVTDEGKGFNWRRNTRPPEAMELEESGRGLLILRSYADLVRFNRRGNSVTLRLRREKEDNYE